MKRGSPYDQVAGRDEITPLKKKNFISRLESWRRSYWDVVFCQTSNSWQDATMDVLGMNVRTRAGVRRPGVANETHCLLELGDKGGVGLLHQVQ